MSEEQKTCFVIMPISTHDDHLSLYRDDGDHFEHVIDHLFEPAVKSIDYKLVRPKAQGSDLIPAEIINNLHTAGLVLCDMSVLNPNVFFELGIRTALNKPVCMVADDKTPNIPFDTSYINFETYNSTLDPWVINKEIEKLKQHLLLSIERSRGKNKLWEYFGIKGTAGDFDKPGEQDKYDYIISQLDSLKSSIHVASSTIQFSNERIVHLRNMLQGKIKEICGNEYSYNHVMSLSPNGHGFVQLDKGTPLKILKQIENYGYEIGLNLTVMREQD